MITLDDLELGDRVIFKGSQQEYPVTHVGAKYFHVALEDGRTTGPYSVDLLAEVVKR